MEKTFKEILAEEFRKRGAYGVLEAVAESIEEEDPQADRGDHNSQQVRDAMRRLHA